MKLRSAFAIAAVVMALTPVVLLGALLLIPIAVALLAALPILGVVGLPALLRILSARKRTAAGRCSLPLMTVHSCARRGARRSSIDVGDLLRWGRRERGPPWRVAAVRFEPRSGRAAVFTIDRPAPQASTGGTRCHQAARAGASVMTIGSGLGFGKPPAIRKFL
jgi:hypothetical protein